ncbi:hypothetical protein HYH03_008015 [Edaphochlamys debaryana]|uniref:Uncharacterized protein n=1 Tax=Edaphochlamys debaryana TaxID=47281 RepID=A0A836BYP5_9CHLO|nr:hypothetical protein HYH03_008015 [Edaphochlamys debaryana]|eukprot:KAG2493795.1 hypothetical protein HYH03_008015 [Edaphochlamys debaryana]
MKTRAQATRARLAFDDDLACWMPEEVQHRLLDYVLSDFRMPVFRAGMCLNPARDIVALMLVCRDWRAYVSQHVDTANRACAGAVLKVAWLSDLAHLAGVGGGSKRTRVNRIPQTIRLCLHDGSSPHAPSHTSLGSPTAPISPSPAPPTPAQPPTSTPAPAAAASTTTATATATSAALGRPAVPMWCSARVVRSASQRSAFERGSFPERVPLLALAAAAVPSAAALRWLAAVLAALDGAFLCPAVLRLTFPPDSGGGGGGGGKGGGGDEEGGGAGGGGGGAGVGGGEGGGKAPMAEARRGSGAGADCAAGGGGGGGSLRRSDVQALAAGVDSLVVGSDGPCHVYLVPTAATLRRAWNPAAAAAAAGGAGVAAGVVAAAAAGPGGPAVAGWGQGLVGAAVL